MPFAAELFGVCTLVSPLDVAFLVLPVPGVDEDDVVFFDPRAIFHSTGDPTKAGLTVRTADTDVIPTQMLRYDAELLGLRGHAEVLLLSLLCHVG
jgi:hypothetical protein